MNITFHYTFTPPIRRFSLLPPRTPNGRALKTVAWFYYGVPAAFNYDYLKLKDVI